MYTPPKRKSRLIIPFVIGVVLIQALLLIGVPSFFTTTTNSVETSTTYISPQAQKLEVSEEQTLIENTGKDDKPTAIEKSVVEKSAVEKAAPKKPQTPKEAVLVQPPVLRTKINPQLSTSEPASKFEWQEPSIVLTGMLRGDEPIDVSIDDGSNSPLSLAYHVKSGDTLSSIWKSIGGKVEEAHAAANAFKKADIALSSIKAGEVLEFTLTTDGHVQELKKSLPEGQSLILTASTLNSFTPEVVTPQVFNTERFFSGTITHSLAQSSIEQGIPYEVVDEFIDLFSGRVEFSREVQRGDSFTVIYDERNTESGTRLSPGPIQAASFMNSGELYVAIRYESKNGMPSYYNQSGEPLGNHFLRYPVKFSRISSVFTKARFHPVLKRWRPHNGVDFAAPTGTPVRATADGKIIKAGYHGGNGNMVKIQHTQKYASAYLHLSRISKGVRVGSKVKRGQVIGAVGSTGLSTGPHLHYSFYVNGQYVDPLKVRLPSVAQNVPPIPEKFLKATLRKLRREHRDIRIASTDNSSANA